MEYEGIIGTMNIGLGLTVLIIMLYYFMTHKTLDELSRRLLLTGFFFGIHELTFFLGDSFVYELTKILFFITLFYSLIFLIRHNAILKERLEEQKVRNKELKGITEEIAQSWLAEKEAPKDRQRT